MCEGAIRRALWLACLSFCATPIAAQQVAPERALLRARIDSLTAAYELVDSVAEAARVARSRASAEQPLDSQRVGPVLVVSAPPVRAAARAAVEDGLRAHGPVVDVAADALARTVLLVELGDEVAAFDVMRTRPGHHRVWLPRWRPPSWRGRVVANAVGAILARDLPPDLREWMGGRTIPLDDPAAWSAAYRDLAADPSPAASGCLEGDPRRCVDALALAPPGASWQRWYTEQQLVAWALRQTAYRATTQELLEPCVARRTHEACLPFLLARGRPPAPLENGTRQTLIAHAVSLGGGDVWRRLARDTTGTLHDRVVAASGVDADSLFGSWRRTVLAARPRHAAGLAGTWLVTILWIAATAALAMRSTRWRLG